MPTIPVYDGPQIRQAPLQGGFQEVARSDVAFGGAQARQLGEVAQAGQRAAIWMQRVQEREDADVAFRAETNLRADYLKFESEAKKTRQGRYAEGLATDNDKWWAEAEKRYTENLTENQRALLAKSASRLKLQSQAQIMQFQDVQLERSHDESWQASKGVIISDTASNPTPTNITNGIAQIKEKNAYQGARKGWDADQLKVQNIKDMTILHSSVIQQLADKDPAAAQKYFDTVPNDEFDGTQRDRIKDGIERSKVQLEAKQRSATVQAENDAEKRVWEAIRDGRQPNPNDLKAMNPEKAVKEVGGYFKALAKATAAKDGRMHAKEDNYEALDIAENAIKQGDITNERDLDRYAPFLRAETFRTLRKSLEKRGEISEKEMERVYSERVGETRAKWIKNDEKAKQWIAFKQYVQDDVREKKRPEDIDALADRWFMKGYGKDDSIFTNDPDTYGEARTKGRKDFVIKTPEATKPDVDGALSILRKAKAATPTGSSAADEFYTNFYLDASRYFAARNEPVSAGRAAAYAILKQNNKPITPANLNAVLEQLKGAPSAGPQQSPR